MFRRLDLYVSDSLGKFDQGDLGIRNHDADFDVEDVGM